MTGVTELTFSSNAEQIFSGTVGGTVHMWDLETKKEMIKFLGHQTMCSCLISDGQEQNTLVSGSEDTKVKVWDIRSGKCVYTYKEHTGRINAV